MLYKLRDQEDAVEIIKKAAIQRRNVLLVGAPGTGKSMLGQALSQLLPAAKLVDILAFPNPKDENEPTIKSVPAGEGKRIVNQAKARNMSALEYMMTYGWAILIIVIVAVILYSMGIFNPCHQKLPLP